MAEGMKANPDYQLVMRFLELIQPGDMDEDSANQLMMIGQRIQNGGALSDKEREMFESVVGAMPVTPPPATSVGQMTDADQRIAEEEAFQQMIMEQNQRGGMSEAELRLAMDTAMPNNLSPEAMDNFMAQKRAAQAKMQDPRATSPRPMLRPNR